MKTKTLKTLINLAALVLGLGVSASAEAQQSFMDLGDEQPVRRSGGGPRAKIDHDAVVNGIMPSLPGGTSEVGRGDGCFVALSPLVPTGQGHEVALTPKGGVYLLSGDAFDSPTDPLEPGGEVRGGFDWRRCEDTVAVDPKRNAQNSLFKSEQATRCTVLVLYREHQKKLYIDAKLGTKAEMEACIGPLGPAFKIGDTAVKGLMAGESLIENWRFQQPNCLECLQGGSPTLRLAGGIEEQEKKRKEFEAEGGGNLGKVPPEVWQPILGILALFLPLFLLWKEAVRKMAGVPDGQRLSKGFLWGVAALPAVMMAVLIWVVFDASWSIPIVGILAGVRLAIGLFLGRSSGGATRRRQRRRRRTP